MKSIIVLIFALVCAGAVQKSSAHGHGGYHEGRKYVYTYTTKMKVQLSKVEQHFTQLEMKSKVELNFLKLNQVMLKVTETVLSNVEELKTKSDLINNIISNLKLPVEFKYESGRVTDIFFDQTDPLWSVNMKKSIVSLFQIYGIQYALRSKTVFKRAEQTVFGSCDTTYDIEKLDGAPHSKVDTFITKVIDTRKCIVSGRAAPLSLALDDGSPIDSKATIEYDISSSGDEFKIQKVKATGVHTVSPQSKDEESIVATTNQFLVLEGESHSDTAASFQKRKETLTIQLPLLDKPEFLKYWTESDYENLSQFILTTINSIIGNFASEDKPAELVKTFKAEDAETLLTLINSVKLCRDDTLKKMWNRADMTLNKRKWLLYILTKCPTDDCINFVLTKIQEINVSKEQIEEYFHSASYFDKPTLAQVEKIFQICQTSKVTGDEQLKVSCYATTSNLLKTLCRVSEICPINSALETNIYTLLQPLTAANAESKEVMHIEGMPATVLLSITENLLNKPRVQPGFYNLLETIIQRQELPTKIRVKALMACKPLIRMNPARLRVILMKLIHDPRQHIELRMVAFVVLMENPTPVTIGMCSRDMGMERSLQVRRFVYDYIRSVATGSSKRKYSREIISASKKALNFFRSRIIPSGIFHNSRHFDVHHRFAKLNTGVYATMDAISTNEAVIPRHISSKLNLTLFGQTFTFLEAELRIEGLQEYFEKYFGADGEYYKKSIMDFIWPSKVTNFPALSDKLSIFTQIKILDRIFFVKSADLQSDMEMQKFLRNSVLFRAAEIEAELKEGKVFNWIKPMVPIDTMYKLPTLAGVPLHFQLTSILFPRVKTEVKVTANPSIFSSLLSSKRNDMTVDVIAKHGMSGIGQTVGSMFFSLPCYDVGVTARSTLNVSTEASGAVSWSSRTKKVEATMDIPQETSDIVTFKVERYYFIKPYPTSTEFVKTDFTKIKAGPSTIGELEVLKVSGDSTELDYEEWTLKMDDSKYLSVSNAKDIIPSQKGTIFRVYFQRAQRDLINLFVPNVGYVTVSQKSDELVIKPSSNKKDRVFKIEHSGLNKILLKTWTTFKVPAGTQHMEKYLAIKDNKLCLTHEKDKAVEFIVVKEADLGEVLRRETYRGGYCIGEVYNVKLCLQGYYAASKSRDPALSGPMEFRVRYTPEDGAPKQLKVEGDLTSTPTNVNVNAKISLARKTYYEREITINAAVDYASSSPFRLQVTPHSTHYNFKKLCIGSISKIDEFKLWLSLDAECLVRHLQVDLLTNPHDIRSTMELQFKYTSTDLPVFWRNHLETFYKKYIIRFLNYTSIDMSTTDNTLFNGVVPGSAVLKLLLRSEHIIEIKLLTPSKTFIFDNVTVPYPVHTFPVVSQQIKLIDRVKEVLTATCSVHGSSIMTFDKASYKYDPDDCDHILVQECSSPNRFKIYFRKRISGGFVLRINDGAKDHEIIPPSTTDNPIFKIDGKEMALESNSEYTTIWDVRHKNLVFMHHTLGLVVSLREGGIIRVKVSPWYHNKLCGLCGNFDGEKSNDLRTPENTIANDHTLFGSSWIVNNTKCEGGCTKIRSLREMSSPASQYCQSKYPIIRCLDSSHEVTEKIKIQAICVPKQNKHLLDGSTGRPFMLTEVMNVAEENVKIPIKCKCGQGTKSKHGHS